MFSLIPKEWTVKKSGQVVRNNLPIKLIRYGHCEALCVRFKAKKILFNSEMVPKFKDHLFRIAEAVRPF